MVWKEEQRFVFFSSQQFTTQAIFYLYILFITSFFLCYVAANLIVDHTIFLCFFVKKSAFNTCKINKKLWPRNAKEYQNSTIRKSLTSRFVAVFLDCNISLYHQVLYNSFGSYLSQCYCFLFFLDNFKNCKSITLRNLISFFCFLSFLCSCLI